MKLRRKRESERIKQRSLMAAAFKPNQRGASSQNGNVSKKRLEYKKQKLRRGLEEQQELRKCLQGINKPKIVANQNLPEIGKSEENLYIKQKNMNIVKSSGRRKKKTSEMENAVIAMKCRTDASYKSKKIDSIMLANRNVFKTGGLQEKLNTKQKRGNSVTRSLKGKNKINVAKLKHGPPCRKLRNQRKQGSKIEPRRSTYLIKTRCKTNTLRKSKKNAPAHQHKLKHKILPENQKSENLSSQRQNLKAINKKRERTSKYQDDDENLPLIELLQKYTTAWPDSNQSKSEGFMVKEEQKLFKLEEISEKRGMQTKQKTVKKRKVVHQDKVLDPYFALKQNLKDLKAENSRLSKQINIWHRRGKVPSSKKHCMFCKEKTLINHHVISKNSSIQTEVQTVAAETQTEITFELQEDTIQVKDITQNDIASLNKIIENKRELAAAVLDSKENLGSNPDYGNLEKNEDFNAKIDLEENRIKYDVCLGENNTEYADHHRSSQKFCYIDVKNGGISENLEPLWNPQSSSEMLDINLLRSKEELKIVEIDRGEAQCSHAVCPSQTKEPKIVELDCDEAQCSHAKHLSQTEPEIVEIDCDEAQCSRAAHLSQTEEPKIVELDSDEARGSHAECPSQTEPKIEEINCDEAQCSRAVCLSQTSLNIRQENLHPSQIMKAEPHRGDCSMLQYNQLLRNSHSHATHNHDTGALSFGSNNLVYTRQAVIPQQEWMGRSFTLCDGHTVTEYVRSPQVNYIANSNFVVNIQQDVVKLAESISQQPLQQVSPHVFIYDPLTRN